MPDDPPPPLVTRPEPAAPRLVTRPPVRPGLAEAVLLTVAYFVVTIAAVALIVLPAVVYDGLTANMGPVRSEPGLTPTAAAVSVWGMVAGYAAGVVFTVLLLRRLVGPGWPAALGVDRLPAGQLLLAVVAFPAFAVGGELLAAGMSRVFGADPFASDLQKAVADLARSYNPAVAVFAIGICPGFAEELFCRGLLGRGLVGRYGSWLGVAATSVLFAALHVYPPVALPVYAAMGAALHYAYLKSGSLWVPIALHALNNGYAALVANGVFADPTGEAIAARPVPVAGFVVGTLVAAGLAMALARSHATRWPAAVCGVAAAGCSAGLVATLLR